jgi:hypothetical protein
VLVHDLTLKSSANTDKLFYDSQKIFRKVAPSETGFTLFLTAIIVKKLFGIELLSTHGKTIRTEKIFNTIRITR